jgi:hypothetical protein
MNNTTVVSFWTYLKDNIPNHLKLCAIIGSIVGGYFVYNYITGLKAQLATQVKMTATLSQQYQQVGAAAVSANSVAPQSAVSTQASNLFGSQIMSLMSQQGAQIQALATMIANIKPSTTVVTAPTAPTATQQNVTTGALTGYPMEELRPTGPPLTSLSLFYDPTQKSPALAFKGSSWTHYQEQFSTTLGLWEQQKTGGYKTTVKLTRTVSKPDPNDPTKLVLVGTEDVPITGANTLYTPADLKVNSSALLSRWTVTGGISKTSTGYQPAGTVDYRVTDRFGITAGAVNDALFGGFSVRLSSSK